MASPKQVEWRAPSWAIKRWAAIVETLEDLDEHSEEALTLRDEIRSLPNFPLNTTTSDLIYIVNTTIN
jgi:hypothetical protein